MTHLRREIRATKAKAIRSLRYARVNIEANTFVLARLEIEDALKLVMALRKMQDEEMNEN